MVIIPFVLHPCRKHQVHEAFSFSFFSFFILAIRDNKWLMVTISNLRKVQVTVIAATEGDMQGSSKLYIYQVIHQLTLRKYSNIAHSIKIGY